MTSPLSRSRRLIRVVQHRKPSQTVTLRLDHGGDSRFMLSIWGTARAGGGGAILADVSKVSGIKPAQGGDLGWAVVAVVTAKIGGIAKHMWSQSDYTRFARKPGDQVLAQLIMEPLGTIIVACIGIICTSNFRSVVGSFNVFLGPLTGIMFADDFLIRKRTMKLTGL
ncbi:NCS1 nucleoside transporter [Colletotrichum melonis]|uniref:NCS1 nucleoside transporter n=1 Tax=Colletotrichum melonis TaxID=1209925 RepID=A0AAI9V098_9PEZI|nr:NCS1 nucleoside transporter [Colletotrichum melonis]